MKVEHATNEAYFHGEDDAELWVHYDNRGEPYRQGVTLNLKDDCSRVSVFLEKWEVQALRDLLNRLYPIKGEP